MEDEGSNSDKNNMEMKKIDDDDDNIEKKEEIKNEENPKETWANQYDYYIVLIVNALVVDIGYSWVFADHSRKLNQN